MSRPRYSELLLLPLPGRRRPYGQPGKAHYSVGRFPSNSRPERAQLTAGWDPLGGGVGDQERTTPILFIPSLLHCILAACTPEHASCQGSGQRDA